MPKRINRQIVNAMYIDCTPCTLTKPSVPASKTSRFAFAPCHVHLLHGTSKSLLIAPLHTMCIDCTFDVGQQILTLRFRSTSCALTVPSLLASKSSRYALPVVSFAHPLLNCFQRIHYRDQNLHCQGYYCNRYHFHFPFLTI